jgi:mannan endo-1,4-beta-mannosidase
MDMHWQRVKRRLRGACVLLLAFLFASAAAAGPQPEASFIKTSGTMFTLAGKPFFVTGVNLLLLRRTKSHAFWTMR